MMRREVWVLLVVTALFGQPTIDGTIQGENRSNCSNSEGWVLIGQSSYPNGGGGGANLACFYKYTNSTYLYLAFSTNNNQSWNVAYGIGIDLDRTNGSGYYGPDNSNKDAWNRYIHFDNANQNFAVEFEFYWWWDGASGSITSDNVAKWTGSGWTYKTFSDKQADVAWTGNSSTGLQALELRIRWDSLGVSSQPTPPLVALWVAGDQNSSAVDVIPWTSTVADGGGSEWTDTDDRLSGEAGPTLVGEGTSLVGGSPIRLLPVRRGVLIFSPSLDHGELLLIGLSGRVLWRRPVHLVQGSSLFIPFPDVPPGVYLARLDASKYQGSIKVLISP